MGNKQTKEHSIDTQQLLKDRYSKTIDSSLDSSKILFVQQKNLSYFFCCCNCCGLIQTEVVEMKLSWMQYAERKLKNQYIYSWSDEIREALINNELQYHFEETQALYVNEIRMIISYYETNRFLDNQITSSFTSKSHELEYQEEEANSIFEDRKKSGTSEKEFFRQIMNRINCQIKHANHPCNGLLIAFQNYIVNYNGSQTWFRDSFRRSNHKSQLDRSTELCNEIIEFIKYFAHALDAYYMLDKLVKSESLLKCFTEINFLSFVISVLFLDSRVYKKVFSSFCELYKEENKEYQENLKLLIKKNITDFDIKDQLQLNMTEIELESQTSNQPQITNPSIQSSTFQQFNIPYQSAINVLKKLDQTQSPTNSLKIISRTYKEIDRNINEYFYKHPEAPNVKSYGTDDIVPILTYVIVKSELDNFGIILKLIEAFTPKQIMTGILGYYLVTIQGCYMRIQNYQQFEISRISLKKSSKSQTLVNSQVSLAQKYQSLDNIKTRVMIE